MCVRVYMCVWEGDNCSISRHFPGHRLASGWSSGRRVNLGMQCSPHGVPLCSPLGSIGGITMPSSSIASMFQEMPQSGHSRLPATLRTNRSRRISIATTRSTLALLESNSACSTLRGYPSKIQPKGCCARAERTISATIGVETCEQDVQSSGNEHEHRSG